MRRISYVTLLAMILAMGRAAQAASIPQTCEATKHKLAGKVGQCLHGAEKKRITSGDLAKYGQTVAKCTAKFADGWQAAEQKAADGGGACPTTGDEATVLGSITARVACITSELATGTDACFHCGNGVIDPDEDCDLGTLGSGTCDGATAGASTFGTLGCAADCTYDTGGCSSCPAGGQIVGGHCWILGGSNESCTTTCTNVGLAYDAATLTYTGSSGSDANCSAVLLALNQPGGASVGSGGPTGGMGCWCTQGGAACNRETMFATTASGSFTTMQRACACQ